MHGVASFATALLALCEMTIASAEARSPRIFSQNSDLLNPANYTPTGTPAATDDVILSSAAAVLTSNGTNLNMGSVNEVSGLARTISNNAPGIADSVLTLGGGDGLNGAGGNPADLVYVGCNSCSLTFQGPNGDDGIGLLRLFVAQSGFFDVAAAGATLNISSPVSLLGQASITKTGAGILNLSGAINNNFNTGLSVNGGTVNFLPEATISGSCLLSVNNFNTDAGSAVTLNLQTPLAFAGLNGFLASPATGTNSATVNLIGTTTNLGLAIATSQANASYAGTIAGSGSVTLSASGHSQTFSGNNSYTGTTTVSSGTLVVDGTTSGQGNYLISRTAGTAALSGMGTIGLGPNGTVTVTGSNSRLVPGPTSGLGSLRVETSGTGGVILGNSSTLAVELAGAGACDQLSITGGFLDLTSSSDTLSITALPGAFDGLDYNIVTFGQNVGGGVFNTVQGLPFNYTVQYGPNSIRIAAVQLPLEFTSAYSRKVHGAAGTFDLDLLVGDPVECRASGGSHTLIFNFTNYMVSGSAAVTTGVGKVAGNPVISGRTMTVNLEGVADAQRLDVTLHNVTDRFSQVMPDTMVTIKFLAGDTNGNKVVNASDVTQVKALSGFATNASNFRADLNMNGVISASDLALVKAHSGAFILP